MLRLVVGNEADFVVKVSLLGGEIFIIGDDVLMPDKGGVGRKLSGAIIDIHRWVLAGDVTRERDNVGIIVGHSYIMRCIFRESRLGVAKSRGMVYGGWMMKRNKRKAGKLTYERCCDGDS